MADYSIQKFTSIMELYALEQLLGRVLFPILIATIFLIVMVIITVSKARKKKLPKGLIAITILAFFIASGFLILLLLPSTILRIIGLIGLVGFIFIGLGLLKLKNVARLALLWLYGLGALGEIIALIGGNFDIGILFSLAIEISVIIYLTRPKVSKLFHK